MKGGNLRRTLRRFDATPLGGIEVSRGKRVESRMVATKEQPAIRWVPDGDGGNEGRRRRSGD